MIMTQSNSEHYSQSLDAFIHQEMSAIHALNDQHVRQILDYSKGFLDKTFPLAQGSHQDVVSYVVYYQHLLAFMQDGRQTGLADPSQFVALCGSRQKPQSILLRAAGRHVELIFAKKGTHGAHDQAGIEDIQLELATATQALNSVGSRWFSMIRGQVTENAPSSCRLAACYTGKDGTDYQL